MRMETSSLTPQKLYQVLEILLSAEFIGLPRIFFEKFSFHFLISPTWKRYADDRRIELSPQKQTAYP